MSERRGLTARGLAITTVLALLLVWGVLSIVGANRGAIAGYLCEQGRTERCASPSPSP